MTHVGRTGPPEPGGRNSAGLIGTLCGVVGMLASVPAGGDLPGLPARLGAPVRPRAGTGAVGESG